MGLASQLVDEKSETYVKASHASSKTRCVGTYHVFFVEMEILNPVLMVGSK